MQNLLGNELKTENLTNENIHTL